MPSQHDPSLAQLIELVRDLNQEQGHLMEMVPRSLHGLEVVSSQANAIEVRQDEHTRAIRQLTDAVQELVAVRRAELAERESDRQDRALRSSWMKGVLSKEVVLPVLMGLIGLLTSWSERIWALFSGPQGP